MSWQLLTAISVLALSVSVVLQRVLLSKDKLNLFVYVIVFQAIVGVILLVPSLVIGFGLPNIQTLIVPAIVSVIAFGVGHIVYAKTLQVVEASAFSVLFATQAVWIMLFGIMLFHESLSIQQVLGTVLIFGSVTLVVKDIRSLKIDRGTMLGLLTGLLFGIAITCWSYVGRHTDTLSWAACSFIAASLVAYVIRPISFQSMRPLLTSRLAPKMLLLAVVYAIGSLAMLYAYKEGAFAVVTPLRQASIIVTVVLALVLLRNERTRVAIKIAAAVVCFIGVVLIVM